VSFHKIKRYIQRIINKALRLYTSVITDCSQNSKEKAKIRELLIEAILFLVILCKERKRKSIVHEAKKAEERFILHAIFPTGI